MQSHIKEKKTIDLLLDASWVIPVKPAGCVLNNHAIAVCDGKIVALGTLQEMNAKFIPKEKVHLNGHALVPGFVNAHTHAPMTLFRGIADDIPLHDWLTKHIWPLEAKFLNEEFVRSGARLAVVEMLQGGTTCFNDMYFFPNIVGEVVSLAGMRAVLGLIVMKIPTIWAKDTTSYLSKGLEVHDAFSDNPMITTALAPHAPYTVDEAVLEQIKELSTQFDLPVHIHVHETQQEIAEAVNKTGERPLATLNRLGLVNKRLAAVHMTQLLSEEIEMLACSGASVLHCPESNLKLASGICPAPQLRAAGINVAIGTDGAASNNDLDMLGEMRTAAFLGKLKANNPIANSATEILHMATLGGACSLGLENQIGSLEQGKAADIVAIDLRGPDTQPVYNPISQIVYTATRGHVQDVWVAGHRVLQKGNLKTIDVMEVISETKTWQKHIQQHTSHAKYGTTSAQYF